MKGMGEKGDAASAAEGRNYEERQVREGREKRGDSSNVIAHALNVSRTSHIFAHFASFVVPSPPCAPCPPRFLPPAFVARFAPSRFNFRAVLQKVFLLKVLKFTLLAFWRKKSGRC